MRLAALGVAMAFAACMAGCDGAQPGPRTYYDFKEDSVARDGVLSRCNEHRDAAANDQECSAARRAAAAAAIEQERLRSGGLEQQSERRIVALRDRDAHQGQTEPAPSAPAFGSPLGGVLPSIGDSSPLDPVQLPDRPVLGVGEIAPPSSQVEIVRPEFEIKGVAVVPERLPTESN
ncbi:MAG TPA: hypothetical protein VHH11_10340 [Gammaproteobacteria bacterium]|nr:hypothetical protein [Gammaproteobacteria bacterium]